VDSRRRETDSREPDYITLFAAARQGKSFTLPKYAGLEACWPSGGRVPHEVTILR